MTRTKVLSNNVSFMNTEPATQCLATLEVVQVTTFKEVPMATTEQSLAETCQASSESLCS